MRYTDSIVEGIYAIEPHNFNKNSGKEVLQYAVGGLLYMPATNTKISSKIISGEYKFIKSLVLDLEDSLGDELIAYGKQSIIGVVQDIKDAINQGSISIDDVPLIFVRVRKSSDITDVTKMLADNIVYITGFNVPKFDKSTCDKFIKVFSDVVDSTKENYGTDLYMMPIIESKNALYKQLRMENLIYIYDALKPIANHILNIRVGGADFCQLLGVRRNINQSIFNIGPVADCLYDIVNVFGGSYIVSGPVWEYFEDKNNKDNKLWAKGLEREILDGKLSGFIGKTCIHPSQVDYIRKANIVALSDYRDAVAILGMNTNLVGVKKSERGCRMNEVKTHNKWAKRVIGLANVYGVKQDD